MSTIHTLINNISNQNIRSFFENKISSFKPEKDIYTNTVKENTPFANPVKIGHAVLYNHEELLVFTCEFNKELTARSARKQQFEIAKKVLKEDFKDGAIFIFYDAQGNFRFSFIRKNYGNTSSKYSNWKRFTYYVNPAETNKTFKNRIDSCSFQDLDSIQEAFSVEKLTKDFYNELFAWYKWALSDEAGVTFPNNTNTSEDDRLKLEEQIIRLITRLLFVWFIKQKKLVPDNLFDTDELSKILISFDPDSTIDGNYYNAILQNLFFATLNKEISERAFAKKVDDRDIKTNYRYAEMFNLSEEEIIELFKPIPFLNGGLFECLDKTVKMDGVQFALDGFSRNVTKAANGNFRHRAFIPNCVFFDEEKGIIPLLKRYNFTVEENAPNEIQVALDPELLGKVFENLLGAFNPETKDTARKQSGSFYTPREIVEFMVNESLLSYLKTHFPELQETLMQSLFQEEDLPNELKNNHALCEQISDTLRKIKILDPACGSGAFPMGILNKMVAILEKLDCKNETTIHDLKLHLIEECIYGIDIQTIAVQISKLRFFISLVVEQDAMDVSKIEANYNVHTLPNLETKFVAANTLIGIIKKKDGEFVGTLFTDPEIEITKEKLLNIRKEHFYAKTVGAKKRLREQDAELRNKLTKLLQDNNEYAPEDAKQFSQWNPYDQNTSSPFFDIEWMFGLQDGFDVVIGNPPYIQMQKDGGKLANLYANQNYKTYQRTGDIYALFYEAGINLLKHHGNINYITSNKWMRAKYGESLRAFFIKYNPALLIDLGADVFENATVDTNVIIVKKEANQNNCLALDLTKEKNITNFETYDDKWTTLIDLTQDSWTILSDNENYIKLKIEKIGKPLKDWNIQINYGIKTGFNEAFIIDTATKERLCKEDLKSAEILKPILRGKDIKKYKANWAGLWLIAAHNGYKEKDKQIPKIVIENYPAVKKHLDQYLPQLIKRSDKGSTPYNLRNCAYMGEFEKEKIVYNDICQNLTFSKLDKDIFFNNTAYFISINSKIINFLISVLNSKVIDWCYRNISVQLGEKAIRMFSIYVEQLPVPEIPKTAQQPFISLVDKIILGKKAGEDTSALEHQIDVMVYHLYELNYEEACVIDQELSKEDFVRYKI